VPRGGCTWYGHLELFLFQFFTTFRYAFPRSWLYSNLGGTNRGVRHVLRPSLALPPLSNARAELSRALYSAACQYKHHHEYQAQLLRGLPTRRRRALRRRACDAGPAPATRTPSTAGLCVHTPHAAKPGGGGGDGERGPPAPASSPPSLVAATATRGRWGRGRERRQRRTVNGDVENFAGCARK